MLSGALEDHLGDVLRKARMAAGVELGALARAAGLTGEDWAQLERSGQSPVRPNFAVVGPMLGLHAQKLARLAEGWLPEPVDLSRWRELRVVTTTRGGNTVNCYLLWDEVSREAALFDTGWEAGPLVALLEENALQLKHLFLTHLHEDHVAAMGELREKFPKLHLHTNSKAVPVQHRNRANDFIHLGSLRITNRETPGHAEEGAIYLVGTWPDDAPHVALVGDTIFAGSIARGFQSWDVLKECIRSQVFSLPEETLLCPGHGPLTTVAQEKRNNPFF
jgi:glyoxylase-like metal-dependent hydrolase (beta-lactamase superfamily II)